MKKMLLLLPALVWLWSCGGAGKAHPPSTLTITSLNNQSLDARFTAGFTQKTGIAMQVIPTLESATDRLEQYRELLKEQSSTPDVLVLDVIWPGMLADDLVDLKPYLGNEMGVYFPELVKDGTVEGRLVAVPFVRDVGLLYYRSDLLREYGFSRPPRSWRELERMAARIQVGERRKGHANFWGYVWQGAPYEGLTCDALEWQASAGGGRIIENDGIVSVDNPRAAAAIQEAAHWVGTISPPGVVQFEEYDAWNVFRAGRAAFMRGWEWYYHASQAPGSLLRGKVGVTRIPGGGVLGGSMLGVSRFSRHKKEAIQLVRFLTGQKMERQRLLRREVLPTLPVLYREPAVQPGDSGLAALEHAVSYQVIARPSSIAGAKYGQVSRAYFLAVHSVLTHRQTAVRALAALQPKLTQIVGQTAK
ncbi:MAG TPA: extracellular solute-binding protein [Bryobacteraceae bacterium]